jgi:formylglycine-generating enzyme required for sulfatase activity
MDTSSFPVEKVTWFDSVEYCNKLSAREGMKPYYELTVKQMNGTSIGDAEAKILGGNGYHLPTDAEWEHSCRAGTRTVYHFGDKDTDLLEYAWFKDNSEARTHAVGEKKPNAFGLYDMHGNVREWIEDMFTNIMPGRPQRVGRGGDWSHVASDCAVTHRFRIAPGRFRDFGLRVARSASAEHK